MIYNVYYGKPPFNHLLGEVWVEDDRPESALALAINNYKGLIPYDEKEGENEFYNQHPVVEPA